MPLKGRRKNFKVGNSRVLSLPFVMDIGASSTLAADGLMIVDVRGRIPEGELLEFLEEVVEPAFDKWKTRKSPRKSDKALPGEAIA